MAKKGFDAIGATPPAGGKVDDLLGGYMGRNGIDGIYYNKDAGKFVIVEVKGSTSGSAGGLNKTVDGDTQLSKNWLLKRIDDNPDLTGQQKADLKEAISDGDVTLLKGEVTNV